MRKVFRILGRIVLVLIVIIGCIVGYIKIFMPNVGKAPDIKVAMTPEQIKRGEYLANSVAVCIDCHSTRDWNTFAGPLKEGTWGAGGEEFGREMGFPGVFYSKNITPYHLKNWTDGEIFRTITTGVNKDDKALFPVMPYSNYAKMDKEDVYAIIAYLRTLPEIKSDIKESDADFPMNIIVNTIPSKASLTTRPDPADSVAYGGYLVTVASCNVCHTKEDKGKLIEGTEFGGGREFNLPGGLLRSSNISSHADGLGGWTKERFIQSFKQYQDSAYQSPKIDFMTQYNTIMPWIMYSKMTESDLSSIYQYLKTTKPISGIQAKFTPRKL